MTTNDILTLARAGFTAQQIVNLAAQAQPAAPAAPAQPVAPAAPAQPAAPSAPAQPVAPAAPAQPVAPAAPAQPVAPAAPAQPVAPAAPAQPAAPSAPAQPAADPNAALMAEIAGLRTAMQNAALLGTAQPPAMSADAALAAIINPPDVLKALEKGV